MAVCVCNYCNKEFDIKPYRLKDGKLHYCSKECLNKWKSENYKGKNNPSYNSKIINCSYCNKDLEVPNHKIKNNKHHFCDTECDRLWRKENLNGKNNPNYKGGNIKVICQWCNKEYEVPLNRLNKTKFCSSECNTNYLNKDKHKDKALCTYCKKEIIRKPSMIKEHNFCDLNCLGKWNGERRNIKVKKICLICDKEYYVQNYYANQSKTCSRHCHNKWLSEVFSQLPEEKDRKIKMLLRQKRKDTKPELMVKNYLIENNIEYISQHPLLGYIPDYFIPDKNLIIEVFGDFWHGNPKKYGEGKTPLRDHQIKRIISDKKKLKIYENSEYNYLILWESDIYKNVDILLNNII